MNDNNVIDIKAAEAIKNKKRKPRRILQHNKEYKISGTLAILLIHFAKFMLQSEKSEMAFIGFVNTITSLIAKEKFEEAGTTDKKE